MESSGLAGGFLSGPNGVILDLESSMHRHQKTQLLHSSLRHQNHMNVMNGLESDHHAIGLMEEKGIISESMTIDFSKGKAIATDRAPDGNTMSDEDEPSFTEDGDGDNVDGGKRGSAWPRMKWTDEVVKLLVSVVAFVGDDGMHEGAEGLKRKSGVSQKKGKWKTVSKIMISKGCNVSPQQCEDKFNDLNKRYKRLNDILGRGTSCRVVENPALMDSMHHLSAKAKDDVRKILSSKHLFYKEMCAYHNGQSIANCHDFDLQGHSLPLGRSSKDDNGSEEEEAEETYDSEDDEVDNEDDNNAEGVEERKGEFIGRGKASEEDGQLRSRSFGLDDFEAEITQIFQDPTKSIEERKEWIKRQKLQLQEQNVSLQAQALDLEKQRFKWLRYRSKKGWELERLKLENQRMKLENERRLLQLKQKELRIDFRRSETPIDPTSVDPDGMQEEIGLICAGGNAFWQKTHKSCMTSC